MCVRQVSEWAGLVSSSYQHPHWSEWVQDGLGTAPGFTRQAVLGCSTHWQEPERVWPVRISCSTRWCVAGLGVGHSRLGQNICWHIHDVGLGKDLVRGLGELPCWATAPAGKLENWVWRHACQAAAPTGRCGH